MNKYLFLLLLHTSSSLFIPVNNFNLIKKDLNSCSNYKNYNSYKPKPLLTLSMTNKNDNNNDNKNRSKIFKINFNNDDLENNDKDVYLILYRIYIYLLIFINWILIVYIIQNT